MSRLLLVRCAMLVATMLALAAAARGTGGIAAENALAIGKATALAIMLASGPRFATRLYLPSAALGLFLAAVLLAETPISAAMIAIVGTAQIEIARRLVRLIAFGKREDRGELDIHRLRPLLAIFGASMIAAAAAAVPLAAIATLSQSRSLMPAAIEAFTTNAFDFVVIVPISVTLFRREAAERRRSSAEALTLPVLTALATFVVFSQSPYPLLFILVSMTMLAAFRLNFVGTALVLVIVAMIATVATTIGRGPIARNLVDPVERMMFLQLFLAVTTASTLPVAAVLSERGRLGALLAENERRLRRLAETAPIAIFRTDREGIVTYGNEQWRQLAGPSVGIDWRSTIAADAAERARQEWSEAQRLSDALSIELPQCRTDGDVGTTQFAVTPEHDETGRLIGWIGTATDVEQRRRAEVKLAASERLYRLLADNSNDMIVRIGLDGVRRYVSPASVKILGFTPEEMTGETPIAAIHPEDRARVERVCRSLLEGVEDPVCNYRQRRADGSYAHLEATYRLIRDEDGTPLEFVAGVRDIDRRRASERAAAQTAARLEESNRLLTMAEGMAGVGHWRLDALSKDAFWSPEVYAIHGLDPADRESLSTGLNAYHPDDRPMVKAHVELGLTEGRPWSHLARIVRPNGEIRNVAAQGQAERAPDGTIVGLFGVFQDVTDRVQAENALVAALDEAHALAKAKSVFLATMSHEIRTPLTGVLGMIGLLRNETDIVQRDRFLDSLEQSASLLTRVLDDVLDFSKIESNNLVLERIDFDLASLGRRTVDLFDQAATAKGLTLSLACPTDDLRVRGDPTRLQQILSNLISNAIKFTDRGAIELRLAIWSDGHRRRVRAEVADTGIGLDEAQRARLFEPFVQADTSTTRRFGGTGLGLAISRRLVEAMDGTIGVYSALGEGSTFWFEVMLDRATGETAALPAERPADAPRLSILLAEDNQVNQMLVSALVTRDGHDVVCVGNGRLAVEAAAERRFDAILMDMQMPEMDGLAATRAIRDGRGPCADVPIIALTADASLERRPGYRDVGLSAFLTKPVDIRSLSDALTAAGKLRPSDPSPTPPAAPVDEAPVLDEEKLGILEQAIGASQLDVLLAMLADEARQRPAVIARLVAIGDLSTAASEGHALKGAALGVGAIRLGNAAREVEAIEDVAEPDRVISTLEDAAALTLAALSAR